MLDSKNLDKLRYPKMVLVFILHLRKFRESEAISKLNIVSIKIN
jgi:hypothetical protein